MLPAAWPAHWVHAALHKLTQSAFDLAWKVNHSCPAVVKAIDWGVAYLVKAHSRPDRFVAGMSAYSRALLLSNTNSNSDITPHLNAYSVSGM